MLAFYIVGGVVAYLLVGLMDFFAHTIFINSLSKTCYRDLSLFGKVMLFVLVPGVFDEMVKDPDQPLLPSRLFITHASDTGVLFVLLWPFHLVCKALMQLLLMFNWGVVQRKSVQWTYKVITGAISSVMTGTSEFIVDLFRKPPVLDIPTPAAEARRIRIETLKEERRRISADLSKIETECRDLELEDEAEAGAYRGKQLAAPGGE